MHLSQTCRNGAAREPFERADATVHKSISVFILACWLQVGYIDDQRGPVCLAAVVVLALSAIFAVSLVDFVQQVNHSSKA